MSIQEAVLSQIPARATYQRDVALGRQRLSGADLQGRARKYGSGYRDSRRRVVDLWDDAGGHIRCGAHGLLTLEADEIPESAVPVSCSMGEAWKY